MAESLYFNCGELKPGVALISNPRPPSPPTIIVNPRSNEPTRVRIPLVPGNEEWICVCEGLWTQGGCVEESSRKCIPITSYAGPPIQRSTLAYPDKASCEADAFSKTPCALSLIECVEQQGTCPTPLRGTVINRRCDTLAPVANRPAGEMFPFGNKFKSLPDCTVRCTSLYDCSGSTSQPTGPITPSRGSTGPGSAGGGKPVGPTTGGLPPKYRCNTYKTIYCPQDLNLPVARRRIYQIFKNCVACSLTSNNTWPEGCVYDTNNCNNQCNNEIRSCEEPPRPLDPVRGPITGPTGTASVYTSERRWSCRTVRIIPCPTNNAIISHTEQSCFECTPNQNGQFDASCNFTSKAQCDENCPSQILVNECPNTSQPTGSVGIPTTGGTTTGGEEPQTIPIVTIRPNGSISTNNETSISIGSTVIAPPSVINDIPRTSESLDIDLLNLENTSKRTNSSYNNTVIPNKGNSLYHPKYNFFYTEPTTETTFVRNTKYLNIFKDLVAEEVKNALDYINTDRVWSETDIFNLTEEKILVSLTSRLTLAINNLHHFGNQQVQTSLILKAIKRLLLTGKIDEFNSEYFISLADRQSKDIVISFKNTTIELKNERVGLGVIAEDAIAADSSKHGELYKEYIKRQKRLNTDIEANFTIQTIENEDLKLNLIDAGVPSLNISGGSFNVNIGDGDGYYVVIDPLDSNTDKALVLDTQIDKTYYSPPDVRYNALGLFNEEPSLILSTSSTSANEFSDSYSGSSLADIMFFGIDLATIESLDVGNPLVDTTRATFRLITNQSEIDNYVLNYGLSITRANVNYDDPFLYYARESSAIELTQSDITFRAFDKNRTIVSENILSRNIPFGLILTPGCGSQHNPFAGFSDIDSFENNVVVRSLRMIPDINVTQKQVPNQSLEFEKFYPNTGTASSIGLIEEKSFEGGILKFNKDSNIFDNRFYKNGFVQSVANTEEFGYSNIVKKIKNLINMHNQVKGYEPESLTWWDVISRLNINQVSRFMYDNNEDVTKAIISGLLGPKMKNVLYRSIPEESYIKDVVMETTEEDIVIIKPEDR